MAKAMKRPTRKPYAAADVKLLKQHRRQERRGAVRKVLGMAENNASARFLDFFCSRAFWKTREPMVLCKCVSPEDGRRRV